MDLVGWDAGLPPPPTLTALEQPPRISWIRSTVNAQKAGLGDISGKGPQTSDVIFTFCRLGALLKTLDTLELTWLVRLCTGFVPLCGVGEVFVFEGSYSSFLHCNILGQTYVNFNQINV